MGLLSKLFGKKVDYAELVRGGAKMIDVRSRQEFNSGHARGSVNIPLDELKRGVSKFKKDDVLIVCCRSGMRSASAKNILQSAGFTQVYNAGPWTNLQNAKS